MSASPFHSTVGPLMEVPVPFDAASLSEVKRDLADVPFEADVHDFSVVEESEVPEEKSRIRDWFERLVSGRSVRRLQTEMLEAELRDLRASYAGLLHSTDDVRDRLSLEVETREKMTKALSPFPIAVAGLEKIHSNQEEVSEVLLTIREGVETTAERDVKLLSSVDSIHGGVGKLNAGIHLVSANVAKVTKEVSGIAAGQVAAQAGVAKVAASLGDFSKKMEHRFEEAAQSAQANAERVGQSGDDVLQVLRQMESNSQRGLWVFGGLLAVLFVVLLCFSAKVSKLAAIAVIEPAVIESAEDKLVTLETPVGEQSVVSTEPVAQVLVDEFDF